MILALRRVLLSAAVAVLVAGALIGAGRATAPAAGSGPDLAGGADPAGSVAAASTTQPEVTTDATDDTLAADLDAVLAADQGTPSGGPAAAGRLPIRGALRHLAAWRKLVHATVVVDLPKRGLTTLQLDHGTIAVVSATSLTIRESGGGSVTVTLGDQTRVRRDGARAAVTDLRTGDEVFAISTVEAGGTTASLVVVPKPR